MAKIKITPDSISVVKKTLSLSAPTGVAPTAFTANQVAMNVWFGTATKSPLPIFKTFRAANNASYPLPTPITCFTFK